MGKISLLVNEDKRNTVFAENYYERLRKLGELCIYDRVDFSDGEYVKEFVKDSEIIITSWESPKIDKGILDACPNLKAVIHGAGSVKPVVTDELVSKNIRMTGSAVAIGEGVAESALAFAISAVKGFYWIGDDVRAGKWWECGATVKDFYEITVGVISGGFVGRHMVKLLKNFHVDILMYDPILTKEEIEEIGAKKVELDELMSLSDVVSVHAPSIPATDNMLNKDNLSLLKDGAVLVNTSRGSVINEADLIEALKTKRIFACLDVTNPEPPAADSELLTLPNVVITPHIAGTCTNGKKRIALHVCEEVERLVSGEKMRTEIDLSKLSTMA